MTDETGFEPEKESTEYGRIALKGLKRTTSVTLRTTAFLAAVILLAVVGAASPSRADGVQYVTLLYTGDLKGDVLSRKG